MAKLQSYGLHGLLVQVHPASHQPHVSITQPAQTLHPHAQQRPQQARCVQYLRLVSFEHKLYVQSHIGSCMQRWYTANSYQIPCLVQNVLVLAAVIMFQQLLLQSVYE